MTFALLIPKAALLIFAVLLLISAAEDARRLIIPNRYCLAIALLYPAYVLSAPAPVDWPGAAAVAAGALAVGFVIFSFRAAGGGDVKLFAAVALWAGLRSLFWRAGGWPESLQPCRDSRPVCRPLPQRSRHASRRRRARPRFLTASPSPPAVCISPQPFS